MDSASDVAVCTVTVDTSAAETLIQQAIADGRTDVDEIAREAAAACRWTATTPVRRRQIADPSRPELRFSPKAGGDG